MNNVQSGVDRIPSHVVDFSKYTVNSLLKVEKERKHLEHAVLCTIHEYFHTNFLHVLVELCNYGLC